MNPMSASKPQPIETAPTHKGSRILGWCGNRWESLEYDPGGKESWQTASWGQKSDSGRWSDSEPTLWLPLPPDP